MVTWCKDAWKVEFTSRAELRASATLGGQGILTPGTRDHARRLGVVEAGAWEVRKGVDSGDLKDTIRGWPTKVYGLLRLVKKHQEERKRSRKKKGRETKGYLRPDWLLA
jgi:hypothetical protein